jgi:Reverse transcriptase (RNA-dependent DNA polymerase)
MPSELALPHSLQMLRQRLASEATPMDVLQVLRGLQQLGVTQAEMQVHVERLRAVNDVVTQSGVLENNATMALDMIDGRLPHLSLRWDAAEIARIYLPEAVGFQELQTSLEYAFLPSDLLPPRPADSPPPEIAESFTLEVRMFLKESRAMPTRADFYRVPKAAFTSRPAALLAPGDRLVYEALGTSIVPALGRALPEGVLWPRDRSAPPSREVVSERPLHWGSNYIVRADVESFYEAISHSLLQTFVGLHLRVSPAYLQALESFLTAIMGSEIGLPQGPRSSDIFASAYLLPVDNWLLEQKWPFVRYADDYYFPAESVVEGRKRIERLEAVLREIGLTLNASKTRLMRLATYQRGVTGRSPRVEALRHRVKSLTEERLRAAEEAEEVESILGERGIDEETLWALLYHNTISIDEVIRDAEELLTPTLGESYARYFAEVCEALGRDQPPDDMLSTERDLSECLVFLAGARQAVQLQHVDVALRWFPRVAQYAAFYFQALAPSHSGPIRDFLKAWLGPPTDTDWVTAWLCFVAESAPTIVNGDFRNTLEQVALATDNGLLTRTGAIRALAAARSLREDVWRRVLDEASPAIRLELAFTALADSAAYPWPTEASALEPGREGG